MLLALLCIILAGAAIALIFALYTLVALIRDKVPYVPTPSWAIEWFAENVALPDGAIVYELGCGDARVLAAIKKRFPKITTIGYERNWWPYAIARIKTRGTGVIVQRKDFYRGSYYDATAVFLFLIHSVMPKVEKLLKAQLTPGATVYSYGFTFPTWQLTRCIINPKNPEGSKIKVYRA